LKAAIDLEKSGVQIIVVTVRQDKVPDGYGLVAPDKTSIIKTDKDDDPEDVAKEIDDLTKKGIKLYCNIIQKTSDKILD